MNQYEVLKELGTGSFGRVLKVKKKQDGSILAMKTIKMASLSTKQKDNALNQVRLLASIDHQSVIGYKGAFFQQCGNILSIVMQYADGGDLTGMIQNKTKKRERFDENFIWKVAFDILKGLQFIHNSNIIHRDIKSANIFFSGGIAKLGDLNVSKVMQGNYATTQTGTPYYISPQIWQAKKYTTTCDIWSLGCLLYQLCALKPPFNAKDLPGLMKKVTAGLYQPIPSKYSKNLALLIKKCLTIDHTKRPSATQLLKIQVFSAMEHPQQGQIQLLDTIRCPKVLKMLNNQLPQQKKPKTLKCIPDQNQQPDNSKGYTKSMKRIQRPPSSDKKPIVGNYKPINYQLGSPKKGVTPLKKPLMPSNQVYGPPGGNAIKIPKIASHKNIF